MVETDPATSASGDLVMLLYQPVVLSDPCSFASSPALQSACAPNSTFWHLQVRRMHLCCVWMGHRSCTTWRVVRLSNTTTFHTT